MTYWYRIGVIYNTVGSRCYGVCCGSFLYWSFRLQYASLYWVFR